MNNIYLTLQSLQIPYTEYQHPAVFTVEESDIHCKHIPGGKSKNLFLRSKKRERYYLVTMLGKKRADLKKLAGQIGEAGLSFASPDTLHQYLGVTPGSVTVLGLIHDTEKVVQVIVDTDLWAYDELQYHPLINDKTLVIPRDGVKRFLDNQGNTVQFLLV